MKFTIIVQENGLFEFFVDDKQVVGKDVPEEIAPIVTAATELKENLVKYNIGTPVLLHDVIDGAANFDSSEEHTAYIVDAVATINESIPESVPVPVKEALDTLLIEADALDDEFGPLHVEESANKVEDALLDGIYYGSTDGIDAIHELEKEVNFAFEEAKEALENGNDDVAYDKLQTFFPKPTVDELTNYVAECVDKAADEHSTDGEVSDETANQLYDAYGELEQAVIEDPYESQASLDDLKTAIENVLNTGKTDADLIAAMKEYKEDYPVDKLAKLLATARDRGLTKDERKTLASLLMEIAKEIEELN
ncbi:hypothetical protein EBZ38_01650 [bacterium]|nr:hypothetical protein [bacterium]